MRKWLAGLEVAVALSAATIASTPARADDGRVAAGVAGGFLGGMLLGGALAPRPYYGSQYYGAPGPVYYDPPPERCYWTRGARYWDDDIGAWRRSRVRVCD